MAALLDFIEYVLQAGLTLLVWLIVVWAVLSWLTAFNVINLRNPAVWRISKALEGIVNPVLAPIRRFLPSMGGLDFSPIILFILIGGVQRYLIPPLFDWLRGFTAIST